jgi:hypothetical protein
MSLEEGQAQQVLPALQGKGHPPFDSQHPKECCRYDGMGNLVAPAAHKSGDAKPSSKKGGNKLT